MIKKIREKQMYNDKWVAFFQDEILLPDGSAGTYAYAMTANALQLAMRRLT